MGVLTRRAGPLERAAARICKEARARVASHVVVRDLNLDVPAGDGRRIEVVANGLPIWQGAQIAVDATIVSPVRRDGQPRPGLTSNRASPSTRQSTANTELTRNSGRLALPPGCRRRGSWRASQPRHPEVLATARAGKGSPAGTVVRSGRSTGPEPALESAGRVRSAPGARLLAPRAARHRAQRPI